MERKRLILVRGLGGTGKTTLSRSLSTVLKVPVLNRDDVKVAVRPFQLGSQLETEIGYAVMNELARVQLKNGLSVVLDANARFRVMQETYEELAAQTNAELFVVTCSCLQESEWRRRIVLRGPSHPVSFDETKEMLFEEFDVENQLRIDSSAQSPEESLKTAVAWIRK